MEGKGDKATAEGMELLRGEVDKLKEELKTSGSGSYACANVCLGFFLSNIRTVDFKTSSLVKGNCDVCLLHLQP